MIAAQCKARAAWVTAKERLSGCRERRQNATLHSYCTHCSPGGLLIPPDYLRYTEGVTSELALIQELPTCEDKLVRFFVAS